MTINTLSDSVYTDFQGLSQLRRKAGTDERNALQEVGKHFEALFVQMMLQSMRQATPGDPLFGGKEQELYQDLFDKQLSMTMASQGRLGLADIIVQQLQRNSELQNPTADGAMRSTPLAAVTSGKSEPQANNVQNETAFSSSSSFVKDILPYATNAAEQLNIDPQVLVAQAALETGWGKNIIRHLDGRSSNNLFGIKADRAWQKETVSAPTLEFRNGIVVKERASFRSYDSLASSFQDYVQFLQNNPRYRDALTRVDDPQQFTNALQEAGYATDPQYAAKIRSVLTSGALSSAMSELKVAMAHPIG
jgi:flagellar protein FlgJ